MVTAKYPNHVWNVDLTIVPTTGGLCAPWFPFSLPQCFPFCWWVALILDHFSRAIVGFAVFSAQPSSANITSFIARAIVKAGVAPKHLISDKGPQFFCDAFKTWAKRRKIKLRFGAVGKYGSISVLERCIRSVKDECTRRIAVPFRRAAVRRELAVYIDWHNLHRPHQALHGQTPYWVYHQLATGDFLPQPNNRDIKPMALDIKFLEGRRHLPVVRLKKAV